MKRLLIFVLLLLPMPLWSATAIDGTCGAATAQCTFDVTATGDEKIIFAYTNSATVPSLPVGWTSIDSGTYSTTGGYQIGCNVSSSGSDTGSGLWTNASVVVGISFSGTAVGTTANCNTTGIGGHGSNSGNSTSFNLPTITFTNATDWAAGFGGDGGQALCAPSGMTSKITAGPTIHGIAMDTEAPVSGWSSTSCTITSSTWMSYVLEVLNAPPPPASITTGVKLTSGIKVK